MLQIESANFFLKLNNLSGLSLIKEFYDYQQYSYWLWNFAFNTEIINKSLLFYYTIPN